MKIKTILTLLVSLSLYFSCIQEAKVSDPLPSWNETPIKQSILNYLNDSIAKIPVEDRLAVFDMDGTLACEKPLWFEMYMAVKGLNEQSAIDPKLLKYKEYQYARMLAANPFDTAVTNNWSTSKVNYIDSMVWKAYAGHDNEEYVDSSRAYLSRTKSPDQRFNVLLTNQFYQPMLELIKLLKEKQFDVYVVSGSVQGVIWSVCPQTINFNRAHLIGTTQILLTPIKYRPLEHKTKLIIEQGIFQPKNNGDGKSLNIYSHIGKVPVFAFGNTTGDFGMFHLASTSKYPNAEYLLNHDDTIREYAYLPFYSQKDTTWQKTMKLNGWKQVDMSKEFKVVWMAK